MSLPELRAWREMGMQHFLVRLSAIGAFAGVASWLLAYGAHLVLGVGMPTRTVLLLAVLRGALFGAILALVLGRYWKGPRR